MAQINKANEYFNTKLYTGNGSTQAVTGVNFQPDWTWIKCRNDSQEPRLVDSVRGTTKYLDASLAIAELTDTNILTSFDTDGFTLGDDAISNLNGNTHASWNWLAGGTASSNTDGTITSSVSANTTSGFSVVTWTGTGANATIGHGISTPQMIILKNRDSAENWIVGHNSNGWTKYQSLNLSDSVSTASNIWQNTAPTSSVFSIGDSGKVNGSGNGIVAYCFAEKKGFSKFGSYVGNGDASNNTFVYTGFKPSFLIIKDTATNSWIMKDNKMNPYNATYDNFLLPDLANAESSGTYKVCDFLSNGFKIGDTNSNYGGSGRTYIYMAFAENPLVGTNNIPATAR